MLTKVCMEITYDKEERWGMSWVRQEIKIFLLVLSHFLAPRRVTQELVTSKVQIFHPQLNDGPFENEMFIILREKDLFEV